MEKLIAYDDTGTAIHGIVDGDEVIIVGYPRLRIMSQRSIPTDEIWLAECYIEAFREAIERAKNNGRH